MFWMKKSKASPLDEKLIRLSSRDYLTVRHVQNGGVLCVGASGSGKTSGPGAALNQSLIHLPYYLVNHTTRTILLRPFRTKTAAAISAREISLPQLSCINSIARRRRRSTMPTRESSNSSERFKFTCVRSNCTVNCCTRELITSRQPAAPCCISS